MKYVDSYWIEKLQNGIIRLLINTTEKGMYYHEYSIGCYVIENFLEDVDTLLEIPKEKFQMEKDKKYISTSMQDKDQISFYYIPWELVINKTEEGKIYKNIIHQYKR